MKLLAGISKFTSRACIISKSIFKLIRDFLGNNAQQPDIDQRKSCSPNHHEYLWKVSAKNIAPKYWLHYSSKTTATAEKSKLRSVVFEL